MQISDLDGKEVWIDGFNTIITLEVMLSEGILFECMDDTIRDLAALRGTYRLIPETSKAVLMLFQTLQKVADLELCSALGLPEKKAIEEAKTLGKPIIACIIAGRNVLRNPEELYK